MNVYSEGERFGGLGRIVTKEEPRHEFHMLDYEPLAYQFNKVIETAHAIYAIDEFEEIWLLCGK